MSTWQRYIKKNPIPWLLEENNPSVRFFTLTEILEKPLDDSEIAGLQEEIMNTNPVKKILSLQNPGGFWGKPEDFYMRSKYKGTVWSFLILAQHGADKNDQRIKNACEFIIKNSQASESGGFSYYSLKDSPGGDYDKVLPCLTGNMIWCMIKFGYLEDPRIQKSINWITKFQRFDDKETKPPKEWPYTRFENCYGSHSCHMGVVKTLKALAEIPQKKRDIGINITIEKAVDYLMKHHIYKRSHNLSKVSKPSWLRFTFPYMYQTDIIEIINILNKLKIKDKRMQDAVDIIVSKQDDNGKWILERTFNGRFITSIEQKDKPSKWITFHALKALKNYYS